MRTLVLRQDDNYFTLTEDMAFVSAFQLTNTRLRASSPLLNFGLVDSTGVPLPFPQPSPLQNIYLAHIGDVVQIVGVQNGRFVLCTDIPTEQSLFVQIPTGAELTENDVSLTDALVLVQSTEPVESSSFAESISGQLVLQEFNEGAPIDDNSIFRSDQSVFLAPYEGNVIDLSSFDVLVTSEMSSETEMSSDPSIPEIPEQPEQPEEPEQYIQRLRNKEIIYYVIGIILSILLVILLLIR